MSEQDSITLVYDEYAARHAAAYTVFRQTYELENPRPDIVTITRDIVSLIIVLALTIVSIASIVVSGSRTIEEFGGSFIGAIAFVMIEGGIMAYGFFIARRNASKERLRNTVKWAMAGLVLTVIVGLGANADAVLRGHGIVLPSAVTIAINLLVALSAPTLAFISSDVLAIELMATEIRRREAANEHEKKARKWQKDLNVAWSKQQRSWGAKIEISKPISQQQTAAQLPAEIDVNLRKFTSIDRPSPKLKQAIEWLREHPEHITTESRKLGELIGVSHATANKAQHYVKMEIDA